MTSDRSAPTRQTVEVSTHAVEQYRQLVTPGLDPDTARAHLERLRESGKISTVAPAWLHVANYAPAYLLLGKDVVLPVLPRGDGWIATTCVTQRTLTAEGPSRRAASQQPLRERTVKTLPERLSRAQRWGVAAGALTGGHPQPERHTAGTPDPATFTRPARVSPLGRVREAWTRSDYQYRLDKRIVSPRLRGCVTIAVVSPKGGVGKSTVTALLGSLLAYLRRDRVVAVETNPDWGSLGRRLVPEHPVFIDELLAGGLSEGRLSPTSLDAQLGRGPNGLMIAPAPTDPERAATLDEQAYTTLFRRLGELVGALVLDCGTGLDDPPARAALSCADQLVLVCDDEPDTASIVVEAAEWLRRMRPPLTMVVNNVRRSSRIEVGALERETAFARGIAIIPRDEIAAAQLHGSHFSWDRAPANWRIPVSELAALLAADWAALDPAGSER